MNPFSGIQIVETTTATEPYEDWSRVRSPSRAARRLKRGYRQNIVHRRKPAAYEIGGTIYAHPEIVEELRRRTIQGEAPARYERQRGARS